jgi:hypothetical protein
MHCGYPSFLGSLTRKTGRYSHLPPPPPFRSFASPLFRENPRKKTVLGEKKKIEKVYDFSYSFVMQLQAALWVLNVSYLGYKKE